MVSEIQLILFNAALIWKIPEGTLLYVWRRGSVNTKTQLDMCMSLSFIIEMNKDVFYW